MSEQTGTLLDYLHRLVAPAALKAAPDRDILAGFVSNGDQPSFNALVARHGPMVLNICRRVLGDLHAAEDAYQAVFMVLARKAGSIRIDKSLAPWLYAVSYRVAFKARRAASRRPACQSLSDETNPADPRADPLAELTARDLLRVLEEEVQRLPEACRMPVALCCLDGLSVKETARRLGLTEGAVKGHLERGRAKLHARLVRRGLTLSAGLSVLEAARGYAWAAPAKCLVSQAVKAGLAFGGAKGASLTEVSTEVLQLAQYALKGTAMLKLKVVAVVLIGLAGVTALGAVDLSRSATKPQQGTPKGVVATPQRKQMAKKADDRLDRYGDPLPEGALARLGTIRFRHGPTDAMALSPDGRSFAASGTHGASFCIWDAATGRALHTIPQFGWAENVVYSPDSKTLLVRGSLIDVVTGKELRRFDSPGNSSLEWAAFSPDGKTVVAGLSARQGNPAAVALLDVATGKILRTFAGHTNQVVGVAYSPDGKTLASGSMDNTVRLWDAATGKQLWRLTGHDGYILSVAFASDGKVVASAGEDSVIHLWQVETGKLLHRLLGHQGIIGNVIFSPDGTLLASGGSDGMIRLWDPSTGKEVRHWQACAGWVMGVAFSPNGKTIASAGQWDHAIRRWETASGKEIDPIPAHTGKVSFLQFSSNGNSLLSTGMDRKVLEWDLKTGRVRDGTIPVQFGPAETAWHLSAIDLSQDSKLLALVGATRINREGFKVDSGIGLYDAVKGKKIRELTGHKDWVLSLHFSPNGGLLASAGKDGIRIWDVAKGTELHHLLGNQAPPSLVVMLHCLAFSPDSKLLAFAGADKTIRLWDVSTGKELRSWPHLDNTLLQLVFSPDGRYIGAGFGSTIHVWAAETGKEVMQFGCKNNNDSIWTLAFSPSGRVLALGGNTSRQVEAGTYEDLGSLHLLEVLTGQEIRHIDAKHGWVEALAFSPDGRALASGGGDSTILLWDLPGHAKLLNPKSTLPTVKELDALWSDLAGDAAKADRALWALALASNQSLPLLKERLKLPDPAPIEQVAKLVADLDSEQFAVRQQAAKALEMLGQSAEAALRKSMANKQPLEVRQRIEQLLQKRDGETLRELRAVEVLEQIGISEARQVLETLVKGAPNPRVAEAAGAALARLANRAP